PARRADDPAQPMGQCQRRCRDTCASAARSRRRSTRAGTLRLTGSLVHGIGWGFEMLGGKFEADQIATGEQRISIPFVVDIVSWHRPLAGPARLVRRRDLVHWTLVGGVRARTQLTGQAGRARVAQAGPHNRLAALATARR